jgi:electron transfer flavoprotein alpha subunit
MSLWDLRKNMSVLVYVEQADGKFKKSVFEAVSYAKAIADNQNTNLTAISIGNVAESELKELKIWCIKSFKCCSRPIKKLCKPSLCSCYCSSSDKRKCQPDCTFKFILWQGFSTTYCSKT